MNFKVCILAAGRGSRLKNSRDLHKSLLPIGNRTAISHIINLFPKDTPFVIAVGHKAEQVSSYLRCVFFDYNIKIINIANYDKEGSGPGLSLLQCKDSLNCPFIFTSADTILKPGDVDLSLDSNWVGLSSSVKPGAAYCTFDGEKLSYSHSGPVFIGMAGVKDHEQFWASLSSTDLIKNEHQVINGINGIKCEARFSETWMDIGNDISYSKAKLMFDSIVEEKNDEAIMIDNGFVVKFFKDENKVSDRIKRATILKNAVPGVYAINKNMYGYRFVQGERLSDIDDEKIFDDFFRYITQIFPRCMPGNDFKEDCKYIHYTKFISRIKEMNHLEGVTSINGISIPPIEKLIEFINFDSIVDRAIPTHFHGDLQPENIIYGNSKFTLIDWRDRFGNSLDIGDFYYDLGKLFHACAVNGHIIRNNLYRVSIIDNKATIEINFRSNLLELQKKLKDYCQYHNLDWDHVSLLGIMQYLGISPLHKEHYGNFLYLYGKLELTKWIKQQTGKKWTTS